VNSGNREGAFCLWRERVRRLIRRTTTTLGFELRRVSRPVSVSLEPDPRRAFSLANRKVPSRFLAPLDRCVSYAGFGYGAKGWHPFTEALRRHLNPSSPKDSCASWLASYYSAWAPNSLAEALICPGLDADGSLSRTAPYAIALPWSRMSPDEAREAFERIGGYENEAFGNSGLTLARDGYGLQGPVSPAKLALEARRLLDLLRSIRCFGFESERESVTAEILMRGEEYRCVVKHGYHRLAVLSALGHTHIPVTIDQLLLEPEVEHWPNVVRGHWSPDDARAYCAHLFTFDAKGWAAQRGLA